MTRVLLLRSIPLSRDARSMRMVASYNEHGFAVLPLFWSRGETGSFAVDAWIYRGRGAYGKGLGGIFMRLGFAAYIVSTMLRHRNRFEVVHAVDLDTAIFAVPLGKILGKVVIYDAFDHIAAMLRPGRIARMLARAERFLISKSDLALFPDPCRLEQYGVPWDERIRILGNLPNSSDVAVAPWRQSGPLRLVYVGTLEARHRALEWLLEIAVDLPEIDVVIAGLGELEDVIAQKAARIPNVRFEGQVSHEEALTLLASADCQFGCYLLSAAAHRYAAPNKLFEHLATSRPLITNTGTPAGQLVQELGSGFVFDGTREGLRDILKNLDRDQCIQRGEKAADAWTTNYAQLRGQQLADLFAALHALVDGPCRQEAGPVVSPSP